MKTAHLKAILGIIFFSLMFSMPVLAGNIARSPNGTAVCSAYPTDCGYTNDGNNGTSWDSHQIAIDNVTITFTRKAWIKNLILINDNSGSIPGGTKLRMSYFDYNVNAWINKTDSGLAGSYANYSASFNQVYTNKIMAIITDTANFIFAELQAYEGQPVVNITYPNNRSYLRGPINLIANVTFSNRNVTNAAFTIWDSSNAVVNQTNLSNGFINSGVYTLPINLSQGSYKVGVFSCDNSTTPDCQVSTNSSFTLNETFVINSQDYNSFVTEGTSETLTINVSVKSGIRVTTGKLYYNGTSYSGSVESNGNTIISKTITTPNVPANSNATFFWSINLDDGEQINSSFTNQTIQNFGIDDCTVYTNRLMNITLYDEETQLRLDAGPENTSIKVSLDLRNPTANLNILNFSQNYSFINPAIICLQNPLNSSVYRMYGLIEYSSLRRFTEFHNIQNYNLTNATSNIQLKLFDLNSSRGTEYKITYKDSNFVPISGAILNIQRKYIEEGVFKTTEVPKTGAEGYTIAHLVSNDVIYNIIVSKDGEVLATFNDVVADCQNPLLTSCNINLNSYASGNLPSDFSNMDDITFTLTYNKSSRIIKSTFTIPSGITSIVSLNATLFDSLGNTSVCDDQLESSGGQLSCAVPFAFGNSTVIAQLYKDGSLVGQAIIKIKQDPKDIYGTNLIFLALFAVVLIIGIGVTDNPMMVGIMMIVGLIVMVALNLIYTPSIIGVGATILWFIVAVIIVLIKGSSRQ